jgi:hypothetical protein
MDFLQMTPDNPDYQNGEMWTVLFNGPQYNRTAP